MFGTTIYTNCAAGQGLEAGAGMQFQSKSPDVDRRLLEVVRRHLLYELPQQLLREGRPVSDFPVSFSHILDNGILGTAAGVYIGREATGNRPGNHLTDAILSENPRDYRSVRPAQLFGAPFWRTEPWSGLVSDPLERWSPGPLTASAAARAVAARDNGAEMLTALVGELRRADGAGQRRIVFLADDAEQVLLWLTAATLLLPQTAALGIGFKVFTNDPARSRLRVVAVNPRWSAFPGTVENDLGYAVFDLIRSVCSPSEVDPEARRWVELFGSADPHQVSEAVEVAAAVGAGAGTAAVDLARAAVLRQPPRPAHVHPILRWLRTDRSALREAYGGTLLSVLADSGDADVLRACDEIASEGFRSRLPEMRLRRLRVELDYAASHAKASPGGDPGALDLPPDPADRAREMLVRGLRDAHGGTFAAVLEVAARFGLRLRLSDARPAFESFARFWIDNPGQDFDPRRWPAETPVLDLVRDELGRRLTGREPAENIGDIWWRSLLDVDTADIASPLDRTLISAAMKQGDPAGRLRLVRRLIRPGGTSVREVADVLWDRAGITVDEAQELLRAVPRGADLGPRLFQGLVDEAVTSDPTSLTALDMSEKLSAQGMLRLNGKVVDLIKQNRWLDSLHERMFQPGVAWDTTVEQTVRSLTAPLVRAHVGRFVEELNRCNDLALLRQLTLVLPPAIVAPYLLQWWSRLSEMRAPNWMAITFYLNNARYRDAEVVAAHTTMSGQCFDALLHFAKAAPQDDLDEVGRHLDRLDRSWADHWRSFLADAKPGRGPRGWKITRFGRR